ncbi:MAG: hypothetical protein FJ263_08045 [Planctomycetes bacterium]|nr:hypothetical protein [Planctomycetota bacterium]
MIDSFWTRRRVKLLANGDVHLAQKWLEDYAGWIYGRAWYGCRGDEVQAARILEQTFLSVAQHLNEYIKSGQTMAEVLLSAFTQVTSEGFVQPVETSVSPELQIAVGQLSTHPLLETEPFWPELIRLCQQALAMLSRDEQEILVFRYLRLESPAVIAVKYERTIADVQTLLYKARHSFRRILESLLRIGSQETSRPIPADLASQEMNLEKIFRALNPKPAIAPETIQRLQEQILAVLTRNKPADWNAGKKIAVACGVVVLCGAVVVWALWMRPLSVRENKTEIRRGNSPSAQQNDPQADSANLPRDIRQVFEMGETKDVQGLLGVLRTGAYPMQIVAAHYLGQFGDKAAIDLLDRAAQKWYAENPTEENPFIGAIEAIENRMRQEIRESLHKTQMATVPPQAGAEPNVIKTPLPEPNVLPKAKPDAAEPNIPPPPKQVIPQPDANVMPETNEPADEPNTMQEEPNEFFIEMSMD